MKTYLVTGSGGGLGSSVVDELLAKSSVERVVCFDVVERRVDDPRVVCIKGDLRSSVDLKSAMQGVHCVIHCAAVVDWISSTPQIVFDVNVTGTENVIDACKECGVQCLVGTSSIDAITGNYNNLVDIDESIDYPPESPNGYCKSKQLAEIGILEANCNSLRTAAIRPAAIYGPRCAHGLSELVKLARSGFYATLGDGSAVCQHVFVQNCAHAHVLLADALADDENVSVRGKVYMITDGPPENYFAHLENVLEGADIRMFPRLRLPFWLCYVLAAIVERLFDWFPFLFGTRPAFSCFAVLYTCRRITYTSERALRDFRFKPKYAREVALRETIAYCRTL